MEQTLWNLFRETGDPMGYLLCRAEARSREKEEATEKQRTAEETTTAPAGPPPASN